MPDSFAPTGLAGLPDDRPPPIKAAQIPRDALRTALEDPKPDQRIKAVATAAFVQANPDLEEWRARKPATKLEQANLQREGRQLQRLLVRTAFGKLIPIGKQPDYKKSVYERCSAFLLLVAAMVTLASSVNVAAAYVIDSGAWSVLVEHPWQAFLFVALVPAGGVGSVLCLYSNLATDQARRRFLKGLAVITLMMLVLWLAGLGGLYALQSMIGDSGGRRLPEMLTYADGLLHAWLLVTQLLTEVAAGALLKLMSTAAHWHSVQMSVVPNPLYDDLKQRLETAHGLASDAAAACGRIEDFERNYQQALESFIADCHAEFARLKGAMMAAIATARADFLRPTQPPAAATARTDVLRPIPQPSRAGRSAG